MGCGAVGPVKLPAPLATNGSAAVVKGQGAGSPIVEDTIMTPTVVTPRTRTAAGTAVLVQPAAGSSDTSPTSAVAEGGQVSIVANSAEPATGSPPAAEKLAAEGCVSLLASPVGVPATARPPATDGVALVGCVSAFANSGGEGAMAPQDTDATTVENSSTPLASSRTVSAGAPDEAALGEEVASFSISASVARPAPLLPTSCLRVDCHGEDTYRSTSPCFWESRDYMRALDFVAGVPMFQNLPKADIPLLVQAMRQVEYTLGEVVIHQGDINDRLFIIVEGEATVFLCEPNKDAMVETRLVTLGGGDYFGEQELIRAEPAHATVRATGTEACPALKTLSVSHVDFWRLGLHEHISIPRRLRAVDVRTARRRVSRGGDHQAHDSGDKTVAESELIASVIHNNTNLNAICPLTNELVRQLADVAFRRSIPCGTVVMEQGDLRPGRFYIVQHGAFEVSLSGRASPSRMTRCSSPTRPIPRSWQATIGPGGSFGELEVLYASPSASTAIAVVDSIVWVLDHADFVVVLRKAFEDRLEGYVEMLRGVPLLSGLFHEELLALAEALTEVSYSCGKDVMVEGEIGSTLFVLVEGEVIVERDGVEVSRLTASWAAGTDARFFGEEELLRSGPRISSTVRVASASATLLALDKASFELVLEPLDDLLGRIQEQGDLRTSTATSQKDVRLEEEATWWSLTSDLQRQEEIALPGVEPRDLEVRGCLSEGGNSSVGLAIDRKTGRQFALKRLARQGLQDPWAQRQALNEKAILSMTCSPFVIKLHQTFRDAQALYFLLELAPGGDLLNFMVRHELYGDMRCARFFSAGTTLALGHLHARRIVHRDLKPENVLLDEHAWPKLTDFGIAKFCVGRAFTVCGTPYYLAPETLLQEGQTEAVDWWALGIFAYEMVAGRTPFECADEDLIKTFAAIQRGIPEPPDPWPWPASFDEDFCGFVASLLRPRPAERLPMRPPRGLARLQAHEWFGDTDWASYQARAFDPPVPSPAVSPSWMQDGCSGVTPYSCESGGSGSPVWSFSEDVTGLRMSSKRSTPLPRNSIGGENWDANF